MLVQVRDPGKSSETEIYPWKQRAGNEQRKRLAAAVWSLIEFLNGNLRMWHVMGKCKMKWMTTWQGPTKDEE